MSKLPLGWAEATLSEFGVEAQSGFPSGKHNAEGRGVPHLRPMNIDRLGRIDLEEIKYVEDDRNRRLEVGDVLFNNTNSPVLIGKTAYFDRPGNYAFSNHMTRLRSPAGVDPKFLAIQLHTFWMRGVFQRLCSHHVNQASVSSTRLLSEIDIALPPLNEQRRIVAAIEEQLSRLDAADASLAAALTRLEGLKLAAYRATLDSDLPTRPLSSVADVRLGRQRSPKNHTGPNMRPYLRAANVTWSGLDLSDVKEMHFTPDEVSTYRLEPGDLLVAEASGSQSEVGKTVIWKGQIEDCCFQNTLLRVRSRGPLPEFLAVILQYSALSGAFGRASPGVGIHHLGAARLTPWPIPVPPLEEQRRIVARVEEQLAAVDALRAAIERAQRRSATLRRAVLERAFRGELVPQDPSDEPAATLLTRIRAERDTTDKDNRHPRRRMRG